MGTIEQGNVLPRRGRILTATTAALLLLAACGSDDKAPAEVISEQVGKVNEQCADAVSADASAKFVIVANDGSTPADELFDSTATAAAEAQPYIHDQMELCMTQNLPGMSGYEIVDPTFAPADPVASEAPASTTVDTTFTTIEG